MSSALNNISLAELVRFAECGHTLDELLHAYGMWVKRKEMILRGVKKTNHQKMAEKLGISLEEYEQRLKDGLIKRGRKKKTQDVEMCA